MRHLDLATTLTAALLTTQAGAQEFTRITGENATVEYDCARDQGNGWYRESGSDYRFKLGFKQSGRRSRDPQQVAFIKPTSDEHYSGSSALELAIFANSEANSPGAAYKVDIASVKPEDGFDPSIGSPRIWCHSFAMKIDGKCYELPKGLGHHLIFEQWWQGSPFHPPVSLVILNHEDAGKQGWADAGGNGNFALALRDDEHDSYSGRGGEARFYDLGPVITDRWVLWSVQLRFDPTGENGLAVVAMDQKEVLRLDKTRTGYNPASYGSPRPLPKIAYVSCCLYRTSGESQQRFYFDDIVFADVPGGK